MVVFTLINSKNRYYTCMVRRPQVSFGSSIFRLIAAQHCRYQQNLSMDCWEQDRLDFEGFTGSIPAIL